MEKALVAIARWVKWTGRGKYKREGVSESGGGKRTLNFEV